ncbi:hypothetical protein [Pseudomonas capsici]|uniref:hypothetical protein n=1 Tax=Pseudomonas capsici TaxID=2810614 RepID=UPI0021F22246|nr:hypothetical protein [Pseudomonas capsici]MCV4285317.1 hypothetical protein [Pseudomonas capsici]
MAGHLISPSDLEALDNYMQVLRELPDFIQTFMVILDPLPGRKYARAPISEMETLLAKAREHLSIWSQTLPAIHVMHAELGTFLTQSSASRDVTPHFIDHCQKGLSSLLDTLDRHREILRLMTQGVYTILPRLIDVLNNSIYRHAHAYGLIEKQPEQNIALQSLTTSLPSSEDGLALSPQARLTGARHYVQTAQRHYAESYCAVANMNAHMARISDLLEVSFVRSLNMRKTRVASRPYRELQLMLVCLREIEHLSRWFIR